MNCSDSEVKRSKV